MDDISKKIQPFKSIFTFSSPAQWENYSSIDKFDRFNRMITVCIDHMRSIWDIIKSKKLNKFEEVADGFNALESIFEKSVDSVVKYINEFISELFADKELLNDFVISCDQTINLRDHRCQLLQENSPNHFNANNFPHRFVCRRTGKEIISFAMQPHVIMTGDNNSIAYLNIVPKINFEYFDKHVLKYGDSECSQTIKLHLNYITLFNLSSYITCMKTMSKYAKFTAGSTHYSHKLEGFFDQRHPDQKTME
ncbi:MAG: hypothetical protein KDH96_12360, partial [Candidatus Riesia sp.]|nr:hypothetical protein [Candidatus Riesia sp.]